MNAIDFSSLYTKRDVDESVTPFTEETGFSIVRNYPLDTSYRKDNKKMFIKLAIVNDKIFYSVNMTKPDSRDSSRTSYILTDGNEYTKKVTNFFSDSSEEFIFNEDARMISPKNKNTNFTINEFISILARNHLSDRLFFKRKINWVADQVLRFTFWLVDKHYEKNRVFIDRYHSDRPDRNSDIKEQKENNIEPFFRYFCVSRNIIFSALLTTFLMVIIYKIFPNLISSKISWPLGQFSLSNPFVVLFLFLILFGCEKLSIWLNKDIESFFKKDSSKDKRKNFIDLLHNYQYYNPFKLKFK